MVEGNVPAHGYRDVSTYVPGWTAPSSHAPGGVLDALKRNLISRYVRVLTFMYGGRGALCVLLSPTAPPHVGSEAMTRRNAQIPARCAEAS